jgi:hypothetical protein
VRWADGCCYCCCCLGGRGRCCCRGGGLRLAGQLRLRLAQQRLRLQLLQLLRLLLKLPQRRQLLLQLGQLAGTRQQLPPGGGQLAVQCKALLPLRPQLLL